LGPVPFSLTDFLGETQSRVI